MTQTFYEHQLADIKDKNLYRRMRSVQGRQGAMIRLDGQDVLNFCSNNYLGLADDPRLISAAGACMEQEGFGSGASRLVCGNMSAHRHLERELARFKAAERALLFSSGYMANNGIIPALFNRDDLILADRLNHASIIDGIKLSQAKFKRYAHCDMGALENLLKQAKGFRKKVIITDSVFSMDGDIAPLNLIVELAQKYDCMVMVDDAHAIGVLGSHGRGSVEHFGLYDKVDIQMGTLSKAVGSFGAYCCGSEELIELLVNKARSFIYTTGMPPAVAAASCESLRIIEQEPQRRKQLWSNTLLMREEINRLGFNTLNSQTPIIPIVVGEEAAAVRFSEALFAQGILIPAIRPPTVPRQTARLRLTVMATHTVDELETALQKIKQIGEELCLI